MFGHGKLENEQDSQSDTSSISAKRRPRASTVGSTKPLIPPKQGTSKDRELYEKQKKKRESTEKRSRERQSKEHESRRKEAQDKEDKERRSKEKQRIESLKNKEDEERRSKEKQRIESQKKNSDSPSSRLGSRDKAVQVPSKESQKESSKKGFKGLFSRSKDKPKDTSAESRERRKKQDQATRNSVWWIAIGGEFFGTFIHVLLGLAIECLCRVASTESSQLEDYLPKLGWGLSWAVAFCVAGGISGGHFNGSVSWAMFLTGNLSIATMLVYWLAQALGALIAGLFAYALYYYPLNRRFGLDDTNSLFVGSAFGGAVNTKVNSAPFFYELFASLIAVFILVFIILMIVDQQNMHVPRPMYPLLIGLLAYTPALLITSYFYYGCAIVNFPVDPVTRLFTLFSWKNDYANAMGGWIGCLTGAAFAVLIYWAVAKYQIRPEHERLNAPVGGPRDSRISIRNK